MNQWWRRGEYAPVIGFYQGAGIAIDHMVTAAAFEGGDLVCPRRGCALIGHCEERTQEPAAAPGGRLAAQALGWEVRLQPFDPHWVHIDVIVCMAAAGLAVSATRLRPRARGAGCAERPRAGAGRAPPTPSRCAQT